jgi:hypothetical protein
VVAKRIHISRPLFLGFFYFFVFFNFLKSLKKNKRMLRYKGGNECHKNTSSRRKEHTNAHSKETCAGKGHSGKNPSWVKVSEHRGKVLQGLRIRHDSKV